ncbi:hypothetical protein KKB40_02970, partial [Patescibacteria group bacterium]|nr:hypothetical protein [Patescibacteria group bacterium]
MQKVGGQKKHKKIILPTLAISLWLFVCIPLLSYFNLKKSLNLGLYGDDWLQFYNIWLWFDVTKTLSFFSLSSYIGPYWPQHFFLGLIRHFYGYEPTAYFVSSLFLRILATISLYPFIKELSKSKLAGILSTIIFAFSVAGLETTDWVFNMNTYAGIFFLNISLYFYLRLRQIKTLVSWHTVFFIITFTLALGVVPVRMHAAMPVLIVTDLFLTFLKERVKFNKALVIRITICILIFVGLNAVGSFGPKEHAASRVETGINLMQEMIQNGQYDFWAYFLAVIGHITFPSTLDIQPLLTPAKTLSPKNVIYGLTTILGGISIIFSAFMSMSLQKKRGLKTAIFFNIFWVLTNWWFSYIDSALSTNLVFSIFIGGELIFIVTWIY